MILEDTEVLKMKSLFAPRKSVEEVEEGDILLPRFNSEGLIPVVTTDFDSGELLMHGYMNQDALVKTIETGEAFYWSRSRKKLWHKGATSGLLQHVREMRIDDDQDSIWLRVKVDGVGASCHVGYRSCFYRAVPVGIPLQDAIKLLEFKEDKKLFDPKKIYGNEDNPTKL